MKAVTLLCLCPFNLMPLQRLVISQVRNLKEVDLTLSPTFNVFFGENGSGKSSILEAVHTLGLGRSFRHPLLNSVITHKHNKLSLTGWLADEQGQTHVLGLAKVLNGKMRLRQDGQDATSIATFAERLPLQLIHPGSDALIQGSAKQRRAFIDWMMFHVEHQFFMHWRRFHRVLKQRNAALKSQQSFAAITCWDQEFCESAQQLIDFRQQALTWLSNYLELFLTTLCPHLPIQLLYQCGWDTQQTLQDILQQQFSQDFARGYTRYGPQRDDLLILCAEQLAAQVLSRGEQKLVVIALRLAQGQLLKALANKTCVFLLDDIMAELDHSHQRAVGKILQDLSAQVLLTTINLADLNGGVDLEQVAMFHVEQGKIQRHRL